MLVLAASDALTAVAIVTLVVLVAGILAGAGAIRLMWQTAFGKPGGRAAEKAQYELEVLSQRRPKLEKRRAKAKTDEVALSLNQDIEDLDRAAQEARDRIQAATDAWSAEHPMLFRRALAATLLSVLLLIASSVVLGIGRVLVELL